MNVEQAKRAIGLADIALNASRVRVDNALRLVESAASELRVALDGHANCDAHLRESMQLLSELQDETQKKKRK